MSDCHHTEAEVCCTCGSATNTCCGDGTECSRCYASFCSKCYNETIGCEHCYYGVKDENEECQFVDWIIAEYCLDTTFDQLKSDFKKIKKLENVELVKTSIHQYLESKYAMHNCQITFNDYFNKCSITHIKKLKIHSVWKDTFETLVRDCVDTYLLDCLENNRLSKVTFKKFVTHCYPMMHWNEKKVKKYWNNYAYNQLTDLLANKAVQYKQLKTIKKQKCTQDKFIEHYHLSNLPQTCNRDNEFEDVSRDLSLVCIKEAISEIIPI